MGRSGRGGWAKLGATLLVLPGAGLAAAGAQTGAGAVPTIRVESRLVEVDIVVRDAAGVPVRGLTAGDFALKENGRPQALAGFVESGVAAREEQRERVLFPYSNVPEGLRAGEAINVVLLDLLNTPVTEQSYAREQTIAFLQELPAQYRCAVFLLTSAGLRQVAPLEPGGPKLAATLERSQMQATMFARSEEDVERQQDRLADLAAASSGGHPETPVNGAHGSDPRLSGPGGAANRQAATEAGEDRYFAEEEVRRTADAFEALARTLNGYPGRKNLLWVSDRFPLGVGQSLELDTGFGAVSARSLVGTAGATSQFVNSQIAIYPVSAAGLQSTNVSAAVSGTGEVGVGGGMGSLAVQQFNRAANQRFAMEQIARETGGEALLNSNDLKGFLLRSVENGSDFYTLTYRPTNTRWDGRYRSIAVRLVRREGSLAYRRGYVATAVPQTAFHGAVGAAMAASAPEMTGLRLLANLLPAAEGQVVPTGRTGHVLRLAVGPGGLHFAEGADGLERLNLVLVWRLSGVTGKDAENTVRVGLDAAGYAAALRDGLILQQRISLPDGAKELRIGVRQENSNIMGTLDVPVATGTPDHVPQVP